LYAIDRRLIFPKEIEPFYPSYMNHITHTLVVISPLFNELTYYMERKCCSFSLTLTFGVSYVSVLLYFAFALDYWVYPVFEVLSPVQQALFVAGTLVAISAFYVLGMFVHYIRWSAFKSAQTTKKNK
jgi:hypothetical protein